MPTPEQIQSAIQQVRDFKSFCQVLLAETLNWPITDSGAASEIGDIAYAWMADELRAQGLDSHVIEGRVWQVQLWNPSQQPWGIFVLEFQNEDIFTRGRGMVGALRRVLRGLVPTRMRAANLPAWQAQDILFICTYRWQHFAFVHFSGDRAHNARLSTFSWLSGRPAQTLCRHNLPHLEWPDEPPADEAANDHWRQQWTKAWDIGPVTDAFYAAYDEVFDAIKAGITGFPNRTDEHKEQRHLLAQTILNRLMFCYFLQKKGWLNSDLGYLEGLAESAKAEVRRNRQLGRCHFYREKLQRFWFRALNTPLETRADDREWVEHIEPTLGEVPYLNGGLFEQIPEWDNATVSVPDKLLYDVIEKLFKPFNFTVEESTPLDRQVALDPEILGQVFEKQVIKRKERGAYYTHRQVVDYMCRQSLLDWLGAHVDVPEEKLIRLVCDREISQLTHDEIPSIQTALQDVMVCDPACGSGAFLVGMMHVLVEIRSLLVPEQINQPDTIYNLKLSVIERNLYGADIDPFACSIAMLRLWLSLAVDHDVTNIADVRPLPNLRFKIRCGDSLVEQIGGVKVNSIAGQAMLGRDNVLPLMNELLSLHSQYLGERDHPTDVRQRIEQIEHGLAEHMTEDATASGQSEESIIWGVHFAEAFRRQPAGFDIIVANPPYGLKLPIYNEPEYRLGSKDSYGIFTARAGHLLRDGGVFCYIMSDTWETIRTHRPLRSWIINNFRVKRLLQMPSDTFSAVVNVCILCAVSRPGQDRRSERLDADLRAVDLTQSFLSTGELDQAFLDLLHGAAPDTPHTASYTYPIGIISKYSGRGRYGLPFFIADPKLFALMRDDWPTRLEALADARPEPVPVRHVEMNGQTIRAVRLGDVAQIAQGLATCDNRYYLRQRPGAHGTYQPVDDDLVLTPEHIANFTARYLAAADDRVIGITPAEYDGRHFVPYDKGGASDAQGGWLPNYYVPTDYYIDWSEAAVDRLKTHCEDPRTLRGKAVIRNPSFYFRKGLTFSDVGFYSPTVRISGEGVFDVKGSRIVSDVFPLYFLLAILCSRLGRMLIKCFSNHTVSTQVHDIGELVVPWVSARQTQMEQLVAQIVERQQADPRYPYHLREQRELDRMVYQLYGLNDEDIAEVERWYARRYPRLAAAQGKTA